MILKYFAFVFFIVLFLIIAFEIIKDMTRERKRIDGKRKAQKFENGYGHGYVYGSNGYSNVYEEKVVQLKKRKKHTDKRSRRDR